MFLFIILMYVITVAIIVIVEITKKVRTPEYKATAKVAAQARAVRQEAKYSYYTVLSGRGTTAHWMRSKTGVISGGPLTPGSIAAEMLWFGGKDYSYTLCGKRASGPSHQATVGCRECKARKANQMATRPVAPRTPVAPQPPVAPRPTISTEERAERIAVMKRGVNCIKDPADRAFVQSMIDQNERIAEKVKPDTRKFSAHSWE